MLPDDTNIFSVNTEVPPFLPEDVIFVRTQACGWKGKLTGPEDYCKRHRRYLHICQRTSFTAEEENEVDVSPSYTEETQMELLSHLFSPQT
ncbi:hypothetical protein AMELA_G00237060 [Ameiurus melas]|uniref:Uncharacterized protein n=1 Tax=Ameiurus melas TaxID=219545 RepID=A0A7J5ZUZ6_AMEME|nr:hypothetical protein AMELA_G00237060 [Ameiurus melas]